MIDEATKKWIDEASYEQLLSKWRFAAVGDPLFQGETGEYYSKIMFQKRDAVGHEAAAATSKAVGWDKR